jgi:hypothetical protein
MEAIAHSPSFAKKVHIPQSVGKDYAAADKGKTFKRGGDMNSKMKMFEKSGKDIEKKGMKEGSKADMALDKKQMMKQGGKVRRMAGGGMGDPFERDTDYDKEKTQGAENLKRVKGFFGFGDKEEAAPIDRSRDVDRTTKQNEGAVYTPRPPLGITKPTATSSTGVPRNRTLPDIKNPESDDNERKLSGPQFANSVVDRGEGEYSGNGLSQGPSRKPIAPRRRPVGIEKTEKKERVITEPSEKTSTGATFKSDLEGRLDQMKPSRKFGMASDETRASVRKGLGSFMDFFDLSKAHEREFGKKMAKGGNVKRMRYGGSPEDGMDMGQPMRGAPMNSGRGVPMAAARGMPATEPEMNPNSIAYLQSKYGMRPQGGNDMNVPMDPRMKAGGSVKKMAEGGFTREADGVAKKGKTQGKMVKMASGGYVKTADGCAQRGKTKAFQVKMNRGGMC